MDVRFQVTDAPRETVSTPFAETPLVTLAWRALRAEHQRRADDRQRADAETRQTREALINFAEETYRLRRAARLRATGASNQRADGEPLLAIADRLEIALAKAGLTIIAPEGEPYTSELMELLENVAQQPTAAITEPSIAEVIAPAILYHGGLARMGKVVIAIPADAAPQANTEDISSSTSARRL
jgi:molecular chaperone GrpE (heat shock protein)